MFDVRLVVICLVEILSTCPRTRSDEPEPLLKPEHLSKALDDPTRSDDDLADIGNRCAASHRYEQALQFYDKAIETSSSFKASHFVQRAECHIKLKNWDAAIADYQLVVDSEPNEEIGRMGLRRAVASKKCSEALDDSLSSDLDEKELLRLGIECQEVEALVEASRCFTAAIVSRLKLVHVKNIGKEAFVDKTIINNVNPDYSMMRDYGAAESDFRTALKMNQYDEMARRGLSDVMFDGGNYEGAIEEVLRWDCNTTELTELGNKLVMAANKFVGAFRCYTKGLEDCHTSDSPLYADKRQYCYEQMVEQEPNKVISDLYEILKMESRNVIVRVDLTRALLESGHTNEAIEVSNELESNELQILGFDFMEKEKFREALVCFTQAIEKKRTCPSSLSYATRGICHRKMGHLVEAIADFNKSIQLQPENWTTHADLCEVLIETGELKEAKAVAEFAEKNIPLHNVYSNDRIRIKELREKIQRM